MTPGANTYEYDGYISRILRSAWWRKATQNHLNAKNVRSINIVQHREDCQVLISAAGTSVATHATVQLYEGASHQHPGYNHLTQLHALAHILQPAGTQVHGVEFVRTWLDLAGRWGFESGHRVSEYGVDLGRTNKKVLTQLLINNNVKTRVVSDAARETRRVAWEERKERNSVNTVDSLLEIREQLRKMRG